MPTTDAYIGMFKVPEEGATVPKILDLSQITLTVEEEAIEQNDRISTNAILSLSNVDISEGNITGVIVEWKLNSGSTWNLVGMFNVDWSSNDNQGEFTVPNMPFSDAGVSVDFRVHFVNSDGEKAIDLATGKVIGIAATEGAGWKTVTGSFNGVDDLSEYAEVENLKATNASNTEGGTYATPATIPNSGTIRLTWSNMRSKGDVVGWMCGDGVTRDISKLQWRKLKGYAVYMYIADSGAPTVNYPDPLEANGDWYLVGIYNTTLAEINCPKNKKIAFWVGAILGSTTNLPTTELPYSTY